MKTTNNSEISLDCQSSWNRREILLVFLILLAAFVLRIWSIDWALPMLIHPDETEVVGRALRMAAAHRLNPDFFLYPSLNIYLNMGLFGILYAISHLLGFVSSPQDFQTLYLTDPTLFYVFARSSSAVFSTLTVGVTYLIARRMLARPYAVLSAVLMAATFLPVQQGHYATPDATLAFFAACAIFFMVLLLDSKKPSQLFRYSILAGFFIGVSVGSKYISIFLGGNLFLAHLFWGWGTRCWRDAIKSFAAGCLSIGAGFLITTPYALLNYSQFLEDNFYRSEILFETGYKSMARMNSWLFYLWRAPLYLSWPVSILFCFGTLAAFWRREKMILFIFSVAALLVFLLGFPELYLWRYLLSVYPCFVLVAVFGCSILVKMVHAEKRRHQLFVLLAVLVIAFPLIKSIRYDQVIGRENTLALARAWVETNIPENAAIAESIHGTRLLKNSDALFACYGDEENMPARARFLYDNPDTFEEPKYAVWELDLGVEGGPARYIQENDIEYVILHSLQMDQYDPMYWPVKGPALAELRVFLDEKAELICAISPGDSPLRDSGRLPEDFWFYSYATPDGWLFAIDRPGPFVWIYQIPS